MPSALLSQILRTQDLRQKQVVAGDRGRSQKIYRSAHSHFEFRASHSAMAERRREIVSLLPQPALAICHKKREYPDGMTRAQKSGDKPN